MFISKTKFSYIDTLPHHIEIVVVVPVDLITNPNGTDLLEEQYLPAKL